MLNRSAMVLFTTNCVLAYNRPMIIVFFYINNILFKTICNTDSVSYGALTIRRLRSNAIDTLPDRYEIVIVILSDTT